MVEIIVPTDRRAQIDGQTGRQTWSDSDSSELENDCESIGKVKCELKFSSYSQPHIHEKLP